MKPERVGMSHRVSLSMLPEAETENGMPSESGLPSASELPSQEMLPSQQISPPSSPVVRELSKVMTRYEYCWLLRRFC
jgi:hypothetical protein